MRCVANGWFDLSQYKEQDPELAAYTGQQLCLHACRTCGFQQPEALPTLPGYFERIYDQHWSVEWIEQEFIAGWKDYLFNTILQELAKRVRPRVEKTLLDVGAHVGRFIFLARQSGWQAEGVEANPRTAAFATRKTGLPVHCMHAQELIAEGRRYDAVTLTDVLEHMPYPVKVLESLHGLVKPGGWIAVKVPCGPSQVIKERFRETILRQNSVGVMTNLVHLSLFTPGSLRRALLLAGFTDVTITVGAPEFMPAGQRTSLAQWLSPLFRLLVYHMARLPGAVHTPLALNVQAYARNP